MSEPVVVVVVVQSNHIPGDDQMAEDQGVPEEAEDRDSGTVHILLLWDREEAHSILYLVEGVDNLVAVERAGTRDRAENDFVDAVQVEVFDSRLDEVDTLLVAVVDRCGNRDHRGLCAGDIVEVVIFLVSNAVVVKVSMVFCNQVGNLKEVGYSYIPRDLDPNSRVCTPRQESLAEVVYNPRMIRDREVVTETDKIVAREA